MKSNTREAEQNRIDTSRRHLLKYSLAALGMGIASLATGTLFRPAQAFAADPEARKCLVTYFSRTGNTRAVAEHIQSRVDGTLFELHTTHTYPAEYRATTAQAKYEQETNFRPQLATKVDNMDAFTHVFIGYPNWWGTLPMAYFTFLESYNFTGKTLIPFCTHEGSGLSRGPSDIAKLCPGAKVLTGFAVRGGSAATSQAEVDRWLKRIELI